jgi:hypothetical protein
MKIEPSIDQAFKDHADRIASGFAAMSPKPARQPFIHNTNMTEPTAPETATETAESSTQQTIRESGLVGSFELTWTPPADIEALTTDLLGKKEKAELLDLNAACIRLADEVSKANNIPVNPAKVALAWHAENPGQPVPQNLIETAANGEELRRCAKTTAKIAAGVFFDENCTPAIKAVFSKAAEKLRDVITQRVKDEQAAFERFSEIYHDGDSVPYAPSASLLRLMARRRQLLDFEILRTSPPSVAATLQGIYRIAQPEGR